MTKDEEILSLTEYVHSRLKTEMYLGSRSLHAQTIILYDDGGTPFLEEMEYVPAVYTAFREIIDNSLDEIAHGFGNRIDVDYDEATGKASVMDNGRGIPFDKDKTSGLPKVTLALSHARTGRNFGERGEIAGTNGLGAATVNFCSEYFKVEVWRSGKKFEQVFKEGKKELDVGTPKTSKVKADRSGTKITFRLSDTVFKNKTMPLAFVRSRMLEISMCNPLIKVYFNGKQLRTKPNLEKNLFPKEQLISVDINKLGFRSRFLLKPNFQKSGEFTHSIVNNIPAFNGGVHIEMFRKMFYSGIIDALKTQSRKRKLTPNRTDINDGLLIFNVTNMTAPNFDAQSKTRLINEEAAKHVKDHMSDAGVFKKIIQKNPKWVDEIYERCSKRTNKADNAEANKLSKKNLRNKVPKLKDANGKDRTKCVLFLAEGDSAISGMVAVRDPEIHGGLGLKGKVMNTHGEKPSKVLSSQALLDIMSSIGLVVGTEAKISELRYGRVLLAHDMDPDGFNIGALLTMFFYQHWPELFQDKENPYFHVFNTPFIIAEKGKQREYWYGHNQHDFDPNKYKGWGITRAKGLGSLTEVDWEYSLKHPDTFALYDDGKLEEALDLIFNGTRADDRKVWIGI